jgi:hypothetical protein
MNWIDTPESSNIARFAYDDIGYVLKVEFKNGGLYDYFDVKPHIFEAMCNAPSKGQYLAQQIKGAYRYARA